MANTGIYKIENKINGKCYVGSSAFSIFHRWDTHTKRLMKNEHHSPHLQAAWNKYGIDSFDFIVLERCSREQTIEREQYWIDLLKPEYNVLHIAGSRLGQTLSEETRKKISEANKNRVVSLETREKLRLVNLGKKHTEETIEKLRNIEFTEERKLKISQGNKGKTLSEEHKAAILKANLGSKRTEEQKMRMSRAMTGKSKSKEHIKNSVKSNEKYEYEITDPDGNITITRSLAEFCKDNDLSTAFYRYVDKEYKGYKLKRKSIK